jgi:hypothetical protein
MANETNMLRIYREGGDIHENTAAAIVGIPLEEFHAWKDSDKLIPPQFRKGARDCSTLGELYELRRYQAKSVNFGFCMASTGDVEGKALLPSGCQETRTKPPLLQKKPALIRPRRRFIRGNS